MLYGKRLAVPLKAVCRKWSMMFFFNLVQVVVVNCFLLHKMWNPELKHKDFVLKLARRRTGGAIYYRYIYSKSRPKVGICGPK